MKREFHVKICLNLVDNDSTCRGFTRVREEFIDFKGLFYAHTRTKSAYEFKVVRVLREIETLTQIKYAYA